MQGTLRLFEKLTIEHLLSDNLSYCPNSTVSLEDQAKLHTLPKALDRILLQKEQDKHAHTKAEAFAVECAAAEATRLGDRFIYALLAALLDILSAGSNHHILISLLLSSFSLNHSSDICMCCKHLIFDLREPRSL